MVSPELRGLRDLPRTRLHLVEKRTSAKNSVHRLLEKYNVPEPAQLLNEAALHASLYEEQIRRIELELQPQLIPNADVQRLLWIPGIGKLVAFTLYLEIDGIDRFDAVRQFFSYCRVVPGADNSAGKRWHGSHAPCTSSSRTASTTTTRSKVSRYRTARVRSGHVGRTRIPN